MIDDAFQRHRDLLLAKRLLEGDRAAFEEFADAYFGALFRFALARIGQNEDTAAELVQDTLVTALRRLDSYRGDGALLTWLCGICRFEISTYLRRQGRRPVEVELGENVAASRWVAEQGRADLPDVRLESKEVEGLVHQVLDELPPHYGQVLEWKYLEGLSMSEIAEHLSIGVKAVESLLTRARKAFKVGFAKQEGAGGGLLRLRENLS